jgi:hypothetical protein
MAHRYRSRHRLKSWSDRSSTGGSGFVSCILIFRSSLAPPLKGAAKLLYFSHMRRPRDFGPTWPGTTLLNKRVFIFRHPPQQYVSSTAMTTTASMAWTRPPVPVKCSLPSRTSRKWDWTPTSWTTSSSPRGISRYSSRNCCL